MNSVKLIMFFANRDRTERDTQIVNVILHAFRNLAFIKDPPADAFKSSDRAEYSSLQVCLSFVVLHRDQG